MMLVETVLNFIAIGLQGSVVRLEALLADVRYIWTVASSPWQFSTGNCIILVVLYFNFMGDDLRDAADPYSH